MRHVATLLLILAFPAAGRSLEPKHVFLLTNKNMPASKEIAEYYCQKRAVPTENIIALDVNTSEDMSRDEYNSRIVEPVRKALEGKKDSAKVLLSIYGVPLRVGGSAPTEQERTQLQELEPKARKLQEEIDLTQKQVDMLTEAVKSAPSEKAKMWLEDTRKTLTQKRADMSAIAQRRTVLSHAETNASVDSELMLLWYDRYELRRWQLNLLNWQVPEALRKQKAPMMMTCRLDGPTPALVKGLVDKALEAEAKGLDGNVYVDARGIRFNPKTEDGFGYGGYDESMREMARLLEKEAKMTVVLDDTPELFKPQSCPKCALYCGWYSLANYIDSFTFVPGAIAWHLASSEAVTLRNKDAKLWCKNLLEKGVTVTLGPVAEPYTIGFPKPAEFFGLIATGEYTMVECYSKTILFASWMTVLVGDPLYNPFAKKPRLKLEQVLPSPKGGRPLVTEQK